jgi:hypothetical protein
VDKVTRKELGVDAVSLSSDSRVFQLRDAVKAKYADSYLKGIAPFDLRVYSKDAYEEKQDALNPTLTIESFGSEDDMLVVLVPPSSRMMLQDQASSDHVKKKPKVTFFDQPVISIRADGFNENIADFLYRDALVEKLWGFLSFSQFVVLSSSPATGKTSLLKLIRLKYDFPFFYQMCSNDQDAYLQLENAGIDLKKKQVNPQDSSFYKFEKPLYIVMLDDAHNLYNQNQFWIDLFKGSDWLPENVKIIISATHSLRVGIESPVDFQFYPRLTRDDFLLSDTEAEELIDLMKPLIVIDGKSIRHAIVHDCGGVIGAVRISVVKLCEKFQSRNYRESDLLHFFLSREFSSQLGRLFGEHQAPMDSVFLDFLKQCFLESAPKPVFESDTDEVLLLKLQKAGVLVADPNYHYEFTSFLAKRFFSSYIFPQRGLSVPSKILELALQAIKNMSSTNLMKSVISADFFPNETVFQHEFYAALCSLLPPSCFICPELSHVFPNDENGNCEKIAGEIDFYLNGDLRWGIELMIKGDGVSEHMSRFAANGKYSPLGVSDYIIIDFRRTLTGIPSNIVSMDKRLSVFFKTGSFSSCVCQYGTDLQNFELQLRI